VGGEDIREKPLLEREEILKGLMPRDPRQCGAAAPDAAEWWDNFKNTLWDSMERLAEVGHSNLLLSIGCLVPPLGTIIAIITSHWMAI
jgi:hypothetical protein